MKNIPEKFHSYLGPYEAVGFDPYCGEPVIWGHKIRGTLGPVLWEELKQHAKLICLSEGFWAISVKELSHEEALTQYGPVTEEDLGPRGGFRSITFGTRTFMPKGLRRPK